MMVVSMISKSHLLDIQPGPDWLALVRWAYPIAAASSLASRMCPARAAVCASDADAFAIADTLHPPGQNRFITVFFYLSDVEEGGETVFPFGPFSLTPPLLNTYKHACIYVSFPLLHTLRNTSNNVSKHCEGV